MISPSVKQLSLLPSSIAHPKERPLLMQGEMVCATLNDLKTQTRRLQDLDRINQLPDDWELLGMAIEPKKKDLVSTARFCHKDGEEISIGCRYGRPGDLLWIRETYWRNDGWDRDPGSVALMLNPDGKTHHQIQVAADGKTVSDSTSNMSGCPSEEKLRESGWVKKPSIFMFRWASRILLEIADIRIERLQSISREDAIAEGLACFSKDGRIYKYGIPDRDGLPGSDDMGWDWQKWEENPITFYLLLWDSINGKSHPSGSNPWVWAIDFKLATEKI